MHADRNPAPLRRQAPLQAPEDKIDARFRHEGDGLSGFVRRWWSDLQRRTRRRTAVVPIRRHWAAGSHRRHWLGGELRQPDRTWLVPPQRGGIPVIWVISTPLWKRAAGLSRKVYFP